MKLFTIVSFVVLSFVLKAQNLSEYEIRVKKADSLFQLKDYKRAGLAYSFAFRSNNGYATNYDSYNALCSWSRAGNNDSAFFQLSYLIKFFNFNDIDRIEQDENLTNLRKDKRWAFYKEIVKDKSKYKPVRKTLDSILVEDQKYRMMLDSINRKYGSESVESIKLWKTIQNTDSLNLIEVKKIIYKHGWLSKEQVGDDANTTLFLVIQHSDLKTQEEFIPVMKKAVVDGKADGSHLALLIDRIEMRNGRKQIYGSQVQEFGGQSSVYPIEDEKNVNKRRAEVGLGKLEDYLLYFGISYTLPK
jgi:hypothetical protein